MAPLAPTPHTSLADAPHTACSVAGVVGEATHADPFQCWVPPLPTTHASLVDAAQMPFWPAVPAGAVALFQAVPLKRHSLVWASAQTSVDEVPVIAVIRSPGMPRVCLLHALPS